MKKKMKDIQKQVYHAQKEKIGHTEKTRYSDQKQCWPTNLLRPIPVCVERSFRQHRDEDRKSAAQKKRRRFGALWIFLSALPKLCRGRFSVPNQPP